MNRIEQIFKEARSARHGVLMPFVTAGHPSQAATEATLKALDAAGAGICELGFPFSDPIADGPVIQASMTEALRAGFCTDAVFKSIRKLRGDLKMGLVAMVSYSIVYRMGVQKFLTQAAEAGFDGLILPDLPLEEAAAVVPQVQAAGLCCSLLVAPTTPIERAERIAKLCSGFVYILARVGITGERSELPDDLKGRIAGMRKVTDLPLAVGFGISIADQVRAVTETADAAIVGSALVRAMGEGDSAPDLVARRAADFVSALAGGLARPQSAGK